MLPGMWTRNEGMDGKVLFLREGVLFVDEMGPAKSEERTVKENLLLFVMSQVGMGLIVVLRHVV